MSSENSERVVCSEVVVNGSVAEVWTAWTTPAGVRSFFSSAGNVELRVKGPYEIFFNLEAEPGLQGGEGMIILAYQPQRMLSFTWNAPPSLPDVRNQLTHVIVRLNPVSDTQTRVTLTHDGWGEGGQWDQAFDYFSRAWSQVVLPRLKYRFAVGPVDWANPPDLSA